MKDVVTELGQVNPTYKSLGVIEAFKTTNEGNQVIVVQLSHEVLPLYDTIRAEEYTSGWWKLSFFNSEQGARMEDIVETTHLKTAISTALGHGETQLVTLH